MLNKQTFLEQFDLLARRSRKIAVVGHLKPDSDAVASILAFTAYLRQKYSNSQVVPALESGFIEEFSKFPGSSDILWSNNLEHDLRGYELVVFMDGHEVKRFFKYAQGWPQGVDSVCIDHHLGDIDQGATGYVDSSAIATAQIVLELFADEKDLMGHGWITSEVAEIVMYGILGDSGTFRYVRAEKARILSLSQRLLEAFDLDISKLDDMFNTHTKETLLVLGKLLERTQYVDLPDGKSFMYSWADFEDLSSFQLPIIKMAIEQYRHKFLRQAKGYDWGFVASPEAKNWISVSFRAKTSSLDMNYVAGLLGTGGGGHKPAAAAKFEVGGKYQNVHDVVKFVLETINKNIV